MTDTINQATGLREGTFGLGTFVAEGKPFPALVHPDGGVVDLSARFADLHAVFDDWDANFAELERVAATEEPTHPYDGLTARPPLAHPNLLMAGANYKTHVAQMLTKNKFNQHNRKPGESDEDFYQRNLAMMDKRAKEGTPFCWTGLHSSLVGANDDVVLPVLGEQPDWELELGVVIARGARLVTPGEAESMIAGYVIVNDLGTVDIFRRTDIPWGYDWISKHQPTFKPFGPFIVPAKFVDRASLQIELKLNGEMMQDWPAEDFVFGPEQFTSYLSERINLLPVTCCRWVPRRAMGPTTGGSCDLAMCWRHRSRVWDGSAPRVWLRMRTGVSRSSVCGPTSRNAGGRLGRAEVTSLVGRVCRVAGCACRSDLFGRSGGPGGRVCVPK